MKPTVKDIATLANVSPATVSNALNNRKGVSDEIKQVVLKAAKQLGYSRENTAERSAIRLVVFKRHGKIITDTPFFSSLIEGIEKECRTQGYELLISHVSILDMDYKENIASIISDNSLGMLVLATEMIDEDLELFEGYLYPIVLLDSCFRYSNTDCVLINNEDAAYRAVNYLFKNGHNDVGYLYSSVYLNNFYYRRQGYLDALNKYSVQVKPENQISLEPTMDGAYRDMVAYIKNNDKLPTAFFADNDIIAFGAMRALKECGIRIPEDVSVIGFDDMPFCEITSPRLTTVKVYKQEMGSIAVKRLVELMDGDNKLIQKIQIDTELIIRESVKKM